MSSQSQQVFDKGEAYMNFAGTLKTKATLKHYLFLLNRYAAYRQTLDLDKIIAEDSANTRMAAATVRQFLLSLNHLAPTTVANYRHALRHFYEMNDVPLNWKKINKFAQMENEQTARPRDRAYTHLEIQQMLNQSNEKVRAIILLLSSSGIRIGAIPGLRVGHLTRIEKYNLYQLLIYAGHKEEYITFCTPEATAAIDSYLSYRKRCGEKIDSKSPVFRADFYAGDIFKVRNKIIPLGISGVSIGVRDSLSKAGLLPPIVVDTRARHEVQRNHGFRKFANTMMVQADLKGAAKEMLLGHSIGLDDKYYRPTPADLLDEYLKAVDLLTINDANRLRKKVSALEQKENELSELKKRLEAYEGEVKEVRDYLHAHPAPDMRLSKKGEIKGVEELLDYMGSHPEIFMEKLLGAAKKRKKGVVK